MSPKQTQDQAPERRTRSMTALAADPGVAAALRVLNAGGGTSLTGLLLIAWFQVVSPFLEDMRANFAAVRAQNQIIAEHVAQLEARANVTPTITQDPRWLLQDLQRQRSGSFPIATAEGATLPIPPEASGVDEWATDTGADVSTPVPVGVSAR